MPSSKGLRGIAIDNDSLHYTNSSIYITHEGSMQENQETVQTNTIEPVNHNFTFRTIIFKCISSLVAAPDRYFNIKKSYTPRFSNIHGVKNTITSDR